VTHERARAHDEEEEGKEREKCDKKGAHMTVAVLARNGFFVCPRAAAEPSKTV